MGRRKIEIQPITRKNGLFKKAYELGVLCSVDVAVIIFEERPGHHVKLYQYCSTDVHSMVQRHLRFDGEKDTRTPADFSNNKTEEVADDDDEEGEDDPTGARQKKDNKHNLLKPKTEGNGHSHMNGHAGGIPIRPAHPNGNDLSSNGIDLDYRSNGGRLPNISTSVSLNSNSSLPISNDRHSSNPSRSNSLNINTLNMGAGAMGGMGLSLPVPLSVPIMPPQKRQRLDELTSSGLTYPYRLDVDLNTYPPTALASSLPQTQNQPGSLNGLFQSNGLSLNMHNGGYLPQPGFDFPTRRAVGYSGQNGQQNGYNGGNQGMFGSRPGQQSQSTNMLVDLLHASSGGGGGGNDQSGNFPAFDWPVTSQQNSQSQDQLAYQHRPTYADVPRGLQLHLFRLFEQAPVRDAECGVVVRQPLGAFAETE
ncbi:hypothetical protein EW026_g5292 [Hermanssonia centrifuga]|uniref:MADS-box domain-containing protein n=1 Tax=Hermanssonia centrifuga TaxID=98765 RepID=A0A4S4KFJ4_9APHY|nr:hypothetical protein EW026_g5292 [Hermanssonia centrifuga]